MYRLGEVEHRHRKIYAFLAGFVALLVVAGFIAAHFLQSNTEIGNTPSTVVTHVSYDTTKLKTFDTPLFTISLPEDWKPVSRNSDIPPPSYTWQGTVKDNANRWLSVYVDSNVANLAVNRELSVQASGTTLNALGDVSDNCTTFTGAASQSHGSTPAKWQGIDFLCDSGNYERDVVGVASPDGLNNVTLTGTKGAHRFFFTYTDNAVRADYSIFINALKSLQLK